MCPMPFCTRWILNLGSITGLNRLSTRLKGLCRTLTVSLDGRNAHCSVSVSPSPVLSHPMGASRTRASFQRGPAFTSASYSHRRSTSQCLPITRATAQCWPNFSAEPLRPNRLRQSQNRHRSRRRDCLEQATATRHCRRRRRVRPYFAQPKRREMPVWQSRMSRTDGQFQVGHRTVLTATSARGFDR